MGDIEFHLIGSTVTSAKSLTAEGLYISNLHLAGIFEHWFVAPAGFLHVLYKYSSYHCGEGS